MNRTLPGKPAKRGMTKTERAFMERVMSEMKRMHPEWNVKPGNFVIDVKTPDNGVGGLYLDNLFHAVQRSPHDANSDIARYLQNFARTLAEQHDSSFVEIRNNLFLAIRPTKMVMDNYVGSGNVPAFLWPVVPDLSIIWAIDLGDRIAHVSRKSFESWNVDEREVTQIAYENTVRAESEMGIKAVAEDGLLISSRSGLQTVAHLLYWLPNLTNLVRRHVPALLAEPVLVSVPSPMLMVVASVRAQQLTQLVLQDVYRHDGRILSDAVHVFQDDQLIARVAYRTNEGLYAIPLAEYGFHTPAKESMPYVPG